MKTYALTTLGCPKNQADSRQMERSLRAVGLLPAENPEEADVHLINSCAFIESAKEETIETVLEAAQLKRRPEQKLVLVGCFSERYAEAVARDLPEVDFCFGTGQYDKAGPLLLQKFGPVFREQSANANQSALPEFSASGHWAPLKISEGCDRACAFCAIPLMRGIYRSLPASEVIEEARRLAFSGVRELCLVSQDTNHFGGSASAFVDLLEALQEIEGISWIRLLYMYPDPLTLKIVREIAKRKSLAKLAPYLESPMQHVSERLLKEMGRYGSFNKFKDFFSEIRALLADIEFRSSLLLGYPGEREEDVEQILKFLEIVPIEKLSLFSYSQEEGTPGFVLGDPISSESKARRINLVREAHLEHLKKIHQNRIGKIYACMIENVDSSGTIVARRAQDAPEIDELVFIDNPSKSKASPGEILPVRITGFYEYDMAGELVEANL